MVKTNDLKEMLFKVGLYNVSKLDDFDFKFSDHKEYLMHILKLEYEARTKHSLEDRIKRSKLPKVDTSKKYSGIDEWNMKELLKLEFIEKCQNIILIGKCGSGKTTAAVQIATKALKEGNRVHYIKIETLLNVLKTKDSLNKSKKTFDYLIQCDLIIIDDLMYIPLTDEEWTMFYKTIMFLNESRSIIFITNRRIEEWSDATTNKHVVETLVDRIINYSRVVTFK